MKNESISFESTLGSPSKPKSTIVFQKPKQIFLVNYVLDNPPTKQVTKIHPSPKNIGGHIIKGSSFKKKNKPINKHIEFHILDFDALLKSLINSDKSTKKIIVNKKKDRISKESKLKYIGFKRFRVISLKESSNPKSKI